MLKKLGIVFLMLLLVIAGGIYYLSTNINSIVERSLEKYGSMATQTSVDVDSVSISLSTGKGSVSGISIGNPKSYVAAKAISVGDVSLQLDTKSIASNGPIIIRELNIVAPHIMYEVGADGSNNLQQLQKNIQDGMPKNAAEKKEEKEEASSRKVIIEDLYVRDGQVTVSHNLLKDRMIKTDLPLVHLRNVGKGGEGATPQELSRQILKQVSDKAIRAGTQAATKELTGDKVKEIGDTIKGFFGK